jgi:hypothetical protein
LCHEPSEGIEQLSHQLPPGAQGRIRGGELNEGYAVVKSRSSVDREKGDARLLFTFVAAPVALTRLLNGSWEQAVIVTPFAEKDFGAVRTRVFVDFFVHAGSKRVYVNSAPFAMQGMRLAFDRSGSVLGPYFLDDIQRRSDVNSGLSSSIRYGYCEMPVAEDCHVAVPFGIQAARPRGARAPCQGGGARCQRREQSVDGGRAAC